MTQDVTDAVEHLRLVSRISGVRVPEFVPPEDRHVVVGGMRLHCLDWGRAGLTPIIFLHGGGLSAHTWDIMCLALRTDHHCLALDQRGHGDSEWSPEIDYTFDAQLRDLETFVDQLELTNCILVGQSMGGINAMRYASRHSERLAGLIVIEAGPYVRQRAGMDRIVDFTLGPAEFDTIEDVIDRAVAFNPRRDPRLLRYSVKHNLRHLPDGRWTWKRDRRHLSHQHFTELVSQVQALASEAEAITCPTLIVRGDESDVFYDEEASAFAALVKDGRWVTVAHSGHNVQGDNPRGLLDAMRPFLQAVGDS
jgi:pimeloyl-ACP methyl ester carboxylesterase